MPDYLNPLYKNVFRTVKEDGRIEKSTVMLMAVECVHIPGMDINAVQNNNNKEERTKIHIIYILYVYVLCTLYYIRHSPLLFLARSEMIWRAHRSRYNKLQS